MAISSLRQKQSRPFYDYRKFSLGPDATSLGLPLVCYLAALLCNDIFGWPVFSALHLSSLTIANLKEETCKITAGVLGHYFLSRVLQDAFPDVVAEGM